MKKMLAACLLLLFVTLASGFQEHKERDEWLKYISTEGRYSVLLPQQPKLSSQETPSAGDKLTQFMAMSTDADSFYMVGYFDYGSDIVYSLDKGRDGMVNAVRGTLLSEENVSLGGYPGRELKVAAKLETGQDTVTRARMYDVKGRVYVLQHLFLKSSDSPAIAEKTARFFGSFKVTTGN